MGLVCLKYISVVPAGDASSNKVGLSSPQLPFEQNQITLLVVRAVTTNSNAAVSHHCTDQGERSRHQKFFCQAIDWTACHC